MLPPHIYYQTNAAGQTKREWLDLPKTTRQSENQDYLLSFANKATFLNKDASGIYTPAGGSVRPQDQKYIYDLLGQVQLLGYKNNPIRSSQDVMALHPTEASRHQFGGSAGNIRAMVSRAGPVTPWAVDLINSVKSIRGGQISGVPDASGENEGTDIGTPSLYRFPNLPASDPLSLKFAMSLLPDSTGLPPQKLLNVINIARQQGFHVNTDHDPEKIIIQNKQNTLKADAGPQPIHQEDKDIRNMLYGARHDIHIHRAHNLSKNQMARRGRYNQGMTNITNIYEDIRQDAQLNKGNLPDGSTETKKVMTTHLPVVDKMVQNQNPNITEVDNVNYNRINKQGGFNSAFQYKLKETLLMKKARAENDEDQKRFDVNMGIARVHSHKRKFQRELLNVPPQLRNTQRRTDDDSMDRNGAGSRIVGPNPQAERDAYGLENEHAEKRTMNFGPDDILPITNTPSHRLVQGLGTPQVNVTDAMFVARGDMWNPSHPVPMTDGLEDQTKVYSEIATTETSTPFRIRGLNAAYPVINPGKRQRFTSASAETERMLRVYEETMDKVRRESAEKKRKLQEKHAARKNV